MNRLLPVLFVVVSSLAFAQAEPEPKIVVVPYPGEGPADAGVAAPVTQPQPPPVEPQVQPPPEQPTDAPKPPPEPPLETRTIDAVTPAQTPALTPPPMGEPPPSGPGAFLDGHPREGAFLSGPGSLTFILHHSIMGGVGMLATQMVPRVIDSITADPKSYMWSNPDSRIAYLAGSLIGAGVGFGASAWWQFTHWMNYTTATFGIVNSFYGAMFLGGMTDLFKANATVISWLALIGGEIGAWLTAIVGGGDMPMNKGALIISGGAWAAIYTALILAVVATTGGGGALREGLDALMITPAIGAAAMAAATLKFNPSTLQIMRANIFGVGVGGAILLISGLVLGAKFDSPVPYILAAVGAVGAKTVVSLLWAEAAENPGQPGPVADNRYRGVW